MIFNDANPMRVRGGLSVDRPLKPLSIQESWADSDTGAFWVAKYETGMGLVWEQVGTTTFDASAIVSGTLDDTRLPVVPVSKGGAGVSLSATGGTSHVVKQSGVGSNFTVGALAASEIPDLGTGKLTSGTLLEARGGTGQNTYATGDILYTLTANTLAKRAIGATGQVLTVTGGVPVWAATVAPLPRALFSQVEAVNVAGGTFTFGAWRTRVLNTEVYDSNAFASLASNRITLPAGTYYLSAMGTVHVAVLAHRMKLYNITAAADVPNCVSLSGVSVATNTNLTVYIAPVLATFGVTTQIELQHRCSTTRATDGFGRASNIGAYPEAYAYVLVEKVS